MKRLRVAPLALAFAMTSWHPPARADTALADAIRDRSAKAGRPPGDMKARYLRKVYMRDGEVQQEDEIEVTHSRERSNYVHRQVGRVYAPGRPPPSLRTYVTGNNDRYGFQIRGKGDNWVLTDVNAPYPREQRSRIDEVDRPYGWIDTPFTYRELLDLPGTRLVSGNTVEWRGGPHRELVFETSLSGGGAKAADWRRYGLFVRPDRPGLVCGTRKYDPENPSAWLLEEVIECQPGDDPAPVPKVIELYVTDKTAGYEPWRVQRIEVHEYTRLPTPRPESEFRLSAFGFPEPKTIPPRAEGPVMSGPGGDINMISREVLPPEPRRWLWLWVLLGVAVLAAAAYYAHRRRGNGGGPTELVSGAP